LDAGVTDFHVHTLASDGTSTVEERVEQAEDCGLDAIAVTDHDRIPDVIDERVQRSAGVDVVAGVEMRADLFETKIEILGYYVDPTDEKLCSLLERAREYRRERNRKLVDRLTEVTDLDIDCESARSEVDGGLGRPYFANRLVDAGVVDSVGAAFGEYLAEDGVAFIPMERLDYRMVIEGIHDAGGVASLAHPGRIRTDRVPEMVSHLADAGLDGIETWYPYASDRSSAYADVDIADAMALADEHNLVPTGGSDCHGPGSGKFRIGSVRMPAAAFERVRERAGTG
jgi:predicted metal-dependent phosphoesterase TrpH